MEKQEALLILNHLAYLKTARMKELLNFFDGDPCSLLEEKDTFFLENNAKWFVLKRNKINFDRLLLYYEDHLKQVEVVFFGEEKYPSLLNEIYDPPLAIFYKGYLEDYRAKKIAIVGSRTARQDSLKFTRDLARDLSRHGFIVVSGMARGIDSAAHYGALEGGSPTIAVLGSGINNIYPKENSSLFSNIIKQGAVLSEFDPDAQPLAAHFPVRNRLVSGLVEATVVIEAKKRSGSLITARLTIENNRDLFAVPGRPSDKTSVGTNELIKNGAYVVTEASDILSHYGVSCNMENMNSLELLNDLNDNEKFIYSIIHEAGKIDYDDLSSSCEDISNLSVSLIKLELKKVIKKVPGNSWVVI